MYHHPGHKPVYLNLREFRFPLNAILSILHRISGVVVVLMLIVGLVWLNLLLLDANHYVNILAWLSHPLAKVLLLAGGLSLSFHWLTGVRHLLMEYNVWQMQTRLERAKQSGQLLLVIFGLWSAFLIWRIFVL